MNVQSATCRIIALLTLLVPLLSAAGCAGGATRLSLENLATESLTPQQRLDHLHALEGIAIDCHAPSDVERVAQVLEHVNPAAESDPVAFSVQAGAIARLYFNTYDPCTDAPWVTPRLRVALETVSKQAARRIQQGSPDLVTTMVWARTATVLDKPDEFLRIMACAKSDPAFQEGLTADEPTRIRLLQYAYERRETTDAISALHTRETTTGRFATGVARIAAIPLYPAYAVTTTIIWEALVLNTAIWHPEVQHPPPFVRTPCTPPTPPPDTRSTDTNPAPNDDATESQRTPPPAQPASATPPRP